MNNEPVAYWDGKHFASKDKSSLANIPLYTHPANPYQSITDTKIEPTVVSYTHPVNTCKHGVDDGACKECYMESTHPVKKLTYEDGIEECAQRAEAYAYMSPNFIALAEELRAILRKAQE